MQSGLIWPAHPKPLPDELLSSWVVRVAEANAIKLQTLSWMLFGNAQSPWNRDIDRSAPAWLLQSMCAHTGTPFRQIYDCTLNTYRGRLFPRPRAAGHLRWVLPVVSYGMTRRGYGMQFCPDCLAEDQVPYYRKVWRLALFTYCPKHRVSLCDACPTCGAPVLFYRRDFGRELERALGLANCFKCGADFRAVERTPPSFPDDEVERLFDGMLMSLGRPNRDRGPFDLGFLAVLHQLCLVMLMHQNGGKFQAFLHKATGIEPVALTERRTAVEHLRVSERHRLLLFALWLLQSLERRLADAWQQKAVRYNHLKKDFVAEPNWYRSLVENFADWRAGYAARREAAPNEQVD